MTSEDFNPSTAKPTAPAADLSIPGTAPSLTVYARSISLQTADIRQLLTSITDSTSKFRSEILKSIKDLKATHESTSSTCSSFQTTLTCDSEKITSATNTLSECSRTLNAAIDSLYAKITAISQLSEIPGLVKSQRDDIGKIIKTLEGHGEKIERLFGCLEKMEPGLAHIATQMQQQEQQQEQQQSAHIGFGSVQRGWEESQGYGDSQRRVGELTVDELRALLSAGEGGGSGEKHGLQNHANRVGNNNPNTHTQNTVSPLFSFEAYEDVSQQQQHQRAATALVRQPSPYFPPHTDVRQSHNPGLINTQQQENSARTNLGNNATTTTTSYVQVSASSPANGGSFSFLDDEEDDDETLSVVDSDVLMLEDSSIAVAPPSKRRKLVDSMGSDSVEWGRTFDGGSTGADADLDHVLASHGQTTETQALQDDMERLQEAFEVNCAREKLLKQQQQEQQLLAKQQQQVKYQQLAKDQQLAKQKQQQQQAKQAEKGKQLAKPTTQTTASSRPGLVKLKLKLPQNLTGLQTKNVNVLKKSHTTINSKSMQKEVAPSSIRNGTPANTTVKAVKPPAPVSTTKSKAQANQSSKTNTGVSAASFSSKQVNKSTSTSNSNIAKSKKKLDFVDVPKRPRVKAAAAPSDNINPKALLSNRTNAATATSAAASDRMEVKEWNTTLVAMQESGGTVSAAKVGATSTAATAAASKTVDGWKEAHVHSVLSTSTGGNNEHYYDDLLNNVSSRRVLRKRKAVQYRF